MTDDEYGQLVALAPIFLIFAVIMYGPPTFFAPCQLTDFFLFFSPSAAAVLWFILSSCMGTPILRALSEIWDYLVLSSRSGAAMRRRRGFGEQEVWEMEARSRTR